MAKSSIRLLGIALILWYVYIFSNAMTCDSCGRECASACGTRNFRTCCFNYLRKRSGPDSTSGSGVRLELMMVVPELAHQYHPSLKNFFLDPSDPSGGAKMLYEDATFDDVKDDRPK